ncbi:MAG TPA: helix-turn-helix domain-containing protein [Stellaceae bacterium]|jgi:CRP/FNR family transcriptional regulator, anaerobic regulatory protein|nr:helix-turn-helix domain-containing protein [Stellaceae bacterium]
MSLAIAARQSAAPAVPLPIVRSIRDDAYPGRRSVCASICTNELDRFAATRPSQSVAPGTTFVDEGEPASHVFTVVSGVVKLFKLLSDGRRQIVGFLVPGDIFGFAPNDKYTASAEAISSVTLYRYPRRQLERAFVDFPGVERQMLDAISRELAAAQDQMVLLGRKTAHERLASFLLSLSRRQNNADQSVDLPMTRTDIADYLGLTMETVSRVFTVLKGSGCIAANGSSKVYILDGDALAELADGIADEDA